VHLLSPVFFPTVCWLPDYFEPTTPVAPHDNHICIGGKKEGMIAFIDLNEFAIPEL
jgi:hypothetical protein